MYVDRARILYCMIRAWNCSSIAIFPKPLPHNFKVIFYFIYFSLVLSSALIPRIRAPNSLHCIETLALYSYFNAKFVFTCFLKSWLQIWITSPGLDLLGALKGWLQKNNIHVTQDHFSNYVQLYIAYDNARLTYPLNKHTHTCLYLYIHISRHAYACICVHIYI